MFLWGFVVDWTQAGRKGDVVFIGRQRKLLGEFDERRMSGKKVEGTATRGGRSGGAGAASGAGTGTRSATGDDKAKALAAAPQLTGEMQAPAQDHQPTIVKESAPPSLPPPATATALLPAQRRVRDVSSSEEQMPRGPAAGVARTAAAAKKAGRAGVGAGGAATAEGGAGKVGAGTAGAAKAGAAEAATAKALTRKLTRRVPQPKKPRRFESPATPTASRLPAIERVESLIYDPVLGRRPAVSHPLRPIIPASPVPQGRPKPLTRKQRRLEERSSSSSEEDGLRDADGESEQDELGQSDAEDSGVRHIRRHNPRKGGLLRRACDRCARLGMECHEQTNGRGACYECGKGKKGCQFQGQGVGAKMLLGVRKGKGKTRVRSRSVISVSSDGDETEAPVLHREPTRAGAARAGPSNARPLSYREKGKGRGIYSINASYSILNIHCMQQILTATSRWLTPTPLLRPPRQPLSPGWRRG